MNWKKTVRNHCTLVGYQTVYIQDMLDMSVCELLDVSWWLILPIFIFEVIIRQSQMLLTTNNYIACQGYFREFLLPRLPLFALTLPAVDHCECCKGTVEAVFFLAGMKLVSVSAVLSFENEIAGSIAMDLCNFFRARKRAEVHLLAFLTSIRRRYSVVGQLHPGHSHFTAFAEILAHLVATPSVACLEAVLDSLYFW